jgi:hypothetical protein
VGNKRKEVEKMKCVCGHGKDAHTWNNTETGKLVKTFSECELCNCKQFKPMKKDCDKCIVDLSRTVLTGAIVAETVKSMNSDITFLDFLSDLKKVITKRELELNELKKDLSPTGQTVVIIRLDELSRIKDIVFPKESEVTLK